MPDLHAHPSSWGNKPCRSEALAVPGTLASQFARGAEGVLSSVLVPTGQGMGSGPRMAILLATQESSIKGELLGSCGKKPASSTC